MSTRTLLPLTVMFALTSATALGVAISPVVPHEVVLPPSHLMTPRLLEGVPVVGGQSGGCLEIVPFDLGTESAHQENADIS